MSKETELVMGVPTKNLFDVVYFSGLTTQEKLISYLFQNIEQHAGFRHRGACEDDPEFKQVIPYCIITRKDSIFVYQRKAAGAEARLHDKASIGVGGHINPEDNLFCPRETIHRNMLRELREELIITGPQRLRKQDYPLVAMVNWDEDAVGKVHLGLVYHLDLPAEASVQVRETDQLAGGFHLIGQLNTFENWETWSQLVIDGYLQGPIKQEIAACQ
jgi:predicted NUDIX family phosphoesterase